jgi:hypothetical protein
MGAMHGAHRFMYLAASLRNRGSPPSPFSSPCNHSMLLHEPPTLTLLPYYPPASLTLVPLRRQSHLPKQPGCHLRCLNSSSSSSSVSPPPRTRTSIPDIALRQSNSLQLPGSRPSILLPWNCFDLLGCIATYLFCSLRLPSLFTRSPSSLAACAIDTPYHSSIHQPRTSFLDAFQCELPPHAHQYQHHFMSAMNTVTFSLRPGD